MFTNTSNRPDTPSISATTRPQSSRRVTSSSTQRTRPGNSAFNASARSTRFLTPSHTSQPAPAIARQRPIATPNPPLPPVTNATLIRPTQPRPPFSLEVPNSPVPTLYEPTALPTIPAVPAPRKKKRPSPDPKSGSTQLTLRGGNSRRLTQSQQEFNRLVRAIETARARITERAEVLDRTVEMHAREVHPRRKAMAGKIEQLIQILFNDLTQGRIVPKKRRSDLREVIEILLNEWMDLEGNPTDPFLIRVFEAIHGCSLEEAMEHSIREGMRQAEEELRIHGMDADLSGLDPRLPPDQIAARLAELEEQAKEIDRRRRSTHSSPGSRRKSARQEAKIKAAAEAAQAVEEARSRDLGNLYRQLAKLLHPDLEQDPVLRAEKESDMKELTTAHKQRDLHTLLRLELKWIAREDARIDQLTDSKLAIYNQVLREQLEDLRRQLNRLHQEPRYQSIQELFFPMTGVMYATPQSITQGIDPQIEWYDSLLKGLNQPSPVFPIDQVLAQLEDLESAPF